MSKHKLIDLPLDFCRLVRSTQYLKYLYLWYQLYVPHKVIEIFAAHGALSGVVAQSLCLYCHALSFLRITQTPFSNCSMAALCYMTKIFFWFNSSPQCVSAPQNIHSAVRRWNLLPWSTPGSLVFDPGWWFWSSWSCFILNIKRVSNA